jgi:ATP-dependent DNA helicase RecG
MTEAVFNPDNLSEGIDIEAKLAQGQHGKGEVPKSVWETYSAFANTEGGLILLGVREKDDLFEPIGIDEPDRVIQDFWNQVNNPEKVSRNLLSDSSVTKYPTEDGRWVIKISVPRAPRKLRPVFINGNPMRGTYKRHHSGDFPCREDEVKRMLAEQAEDARDARILAGYDFDDIDMDSFKAYRSRLAALKPDHPFNTADNRDFLRKIGGWSVDRESGEQWLTLAGLLMFGKHGSIRDVVPNYFVDYREIPSSGTKTEWIDRLTPDGTWSGNLYDFYRSAIQRLFRDLKVPFRLEKDEREDETPVHKALREALVNSIVHADYFAEVSILVVKAPDFFGFRNPGLMRIPIEQAFQGGTSDCRNRSLQLMFSLIGLGEQAGSGIPRVIENWKTQHYRLPELWESREPDSTLMRLRTVSLLPDETLEELRRHFGDKFEALGENGRLALATAEIEGFVTNARLQQICRLHPRDITALLKKLVDESFLEPDGTGRATTYRVAGSAALDMADIVDFSESFSRSEHLPSSSVHLPPSSVHSYSREEFYEEVSEPTADEELIKIAKPVSSNRKVAPEITRKTIIELCRNRFLTLQELASLLKRSPDSLRPRFIKAMVDEEKVLERRYPQQPNHEKQAYRTRSSSNE